VLDFLSKPAVAVGSGLATGPGGKVIGKVIGEMSWREVLAKASFPKRGVCQKRSLGKIKF
jgi:hypothetical protein